MAYRTMLDPITDSVEKEQMSLASRPSTLEKKCVGLLANGKPAAMPTLAVVSERLEEKYPNANVTVYDVEVLNRLKSDEELARIGDWAATETDVCVTALGDCGSCTKFLVYATDAIEAAGIPAVGLIDEGFELDWQMNSRDMGRDLRSYSFPELAGVTDRERIRRVITSDVFDDIESALVDPEDAGVDRSTSTASSSGDSTKQDRGN